MSFHPRIPQKTPLLRRCALLSLDPDFSWHGHFVIIQAALPCLFIPGTTSSNLGSPEDLSAQASPAITRVDETNPSRRNVALSHRLPGGVMSHTSPILHISPQRMRARRMEWKPRGTSQSVGQRIEVQEEWRMTTNQQQ